MILTLAPPAQVQPASDAQSYEDAVANRLAGRPAEAAQALSVIVQNNPANADAWLNLGLADFALGRNDAAEAALQTTLRIAPEYADAGIALARVALTKGDIPAARTRLQAVLAHDPNNQEAKELARTLSADAAPARLEVPSAPRWRADAVAGYSRLSGRAPWREYDVAIGGRVNDRDNAVIGIERSSRFGLNDTFASLRIDHGFSSGWSVYGALAGAPGSHFRPREQVQAGFSSAALHLTQDGRWAVNGGLDVTAARYPVGGVTTVSPFASLQAPKGVTLLVQVIVSGVEHAGTLSGYHVAADWAATRKLSLAVGYTDAPESDTGRTMPVKAESAAVGWSFTDTFALRLIGVHETRPGLKRDEIDLAVTRRF